MSHIVDVRVTPDPVRDEKHNILFWTYVVSVQFSDGSLIHIELTQRMNKQQTVEEITNATL